jgi:hypothetical protein
MGHHKALSCRFVPKPFAEAVHLTRYVIRDAPLAAGRYSCP